MRVYATSGERYNIFDLALTQTTATGSTLHLPTYRYGVWVSEGTATGMEKKTRNSSPPPAWTGPTVTPPGPAGATSAEWVIDFPRNQ